MHLWQEKQKYTTNQQSLMRQSVTESSTPDLLATNSELRPHYIPCCLLRLHLHQPRPLLHLERLRRLPELLHLGLRLDIRFDRDRDRAVFALVVVVVRAERRSGWAPLFSSHHSCRCWRWCFPLTDAAGAGAASFFLLYGKNGDKTRHFDGHTTRVSSAFATV